jgi:hypothetical protein
MKPTEFVDYSVGTVWGVKGDFSPATESVSAAGFAVPQPAIRSRFCI